VIARIASRLRREESGFTLVELITASAVGMIVVLAALALLDSSSSTATSVENRVEAVQRGRTAMEQITQRLRSQTCLTTGVPAILDGNDNTVTYYSELGGETYQPEIRQLSYSAGTVTEKVWNSTGTAPNFTFPGYPNTPSVNRQLVTKIAQAPNGSGSLPFFRYYTYLGNDPATPAQLLTTPLSTADEARVVRMVIAFDARPSKRGSTQNREDSTFENEVFVRTSDPTDPDHSPQCL
jgi:type II secretory pathway pseudopilin PulG